MTTLSFSFSPEVWGPHYWFLLHTIARTFPDRPNEVTRRKYYDMVQNLPLFIPHTKIADHVLSLLEQFPVQPYLTNRESFHRWVLFLHNRVNRSLHQPEFTMEEEDVAYRRLYEPSEFVPYANREWIVNTALIVSLLILLLLLRP
jgi:hypothetical protein